MSLHTCVRCGYQAPSNSRLIEHLARVKPCPCTNSDQDRTTLITGLVRDETNMRHACSFCGKRFGSRSGKCNHQKICKSRPAGGDVAAPGPSTPAASVTINHNVTNVTNHVNNHVTITNNTTVIIVPFREEDLRYLLEDYEFMRSCLKQMSQGVVDFVSASQFDPKHPENSNIRATNIRLPIVKTFDGTTWYIKDRDTVVRELVNGGIAELAQFHDRFPRERLDIRINKWVALMKKDAGTNPDTAKVMRDMERDVFYMIHSNSNTS